MKHYWLAALIPTLALIGGIMVAYADVKSDIARHEQSLCSMKSLPQDVARLEEKTDWIVGFLKNSRK